jgi:hypothetical protein
MITFIVWRVEHNLHLLDIATMNEMILHIKLYLHFSYCNKNRN